MNTSINEVINTDLPVVQSNQPEIDIFSEIEQENLEFDKGMMRYEKEKREFAAGFYQKSESPERVLKFKSHFDKLMKVSRRSDPWKFLEFIGYTQPEKPKKLNPDGTEKVRTRMVVTPELIQKVKDLKEEGKTGKQIQTETGLSESSVSKILNGTRDVVGRN